MIRLNKGIYHISYNLKGTLSEETTVTTCLYADQNKIESSRQFVHGKANESVSIEANVIHNVTSNDTNIDIHYNVQFGTFYIEPFVLVAYPVF